MKVCSGLLLTLLATAVVAAPRGSPLNAEVEGNTVVIYSSVKKPAGCKASVLFSYLKEGQRQKRKLECNFRVPAQSHYRFCAQSNPEFVDLRIEGATVGGCE